MAHFLRNQKLHRVSRIMMLSLSVVFLQSCSHIKKDLEEINSDDTKKEEPGKADRFAFLKSEMREIPKDTVTTESINEELVKTDSDKDVPTSLKSKTEKIPVTALAPKTEKAREPLHFYDDFIILNGDEEVAVNLVFNSAPLLDVIPSFADALGFNFLADSDLKGVVTLNIDQKMTRRELWNTFDKMLNLSGAGVTVEGTLLRIMALPKVARQADSRLAKDGTGELFYYPLKNTTAKEVVNQIKPFVGNNAVCVELTRPNAVMIADDRANMPKIKQLLDVIDMSGKSNWKRKILLCSNILPSKLTDELKTILPVLGFNVQQITDKTETPGSVQISGLDRLHILVVSAATDEAIQEIEQWVDLLDSSNSLDQERVFVYKIRHNKAAQLAQALSVIYDIQGSSLTIDTTTGNSKMETVTSTQVNRNRTAANTRSRTAAGQADINSTENTLTDRSSNVFNTPVRVFADGVLNRLVIRTTPRTYASIKALINRLDVVPAQVLLQVLVVEVTLSESTQFGLELSGSYSGKTNSLIGTNYSNLTTPTVTTTKDENTGEITRATNRQTGFSYFLSDPDNPSNKFAYIRALAGNGNIKVVSSPQLLVSSHTEASINVGTEVSVITGSITNTSSDGGVQNAYQYQKTGVTLTVTPQITSNDLIALKIKQELSSVDYANATAENPNPNLNSRAIDTNMTITNGKTMVLGGLIQEKKTDNLDSVPLINQVPILRRLIGSTDASVERSEILVLVTGYIVNERNKVEELIERYNDALKALNDFDENLSGKNGVFLTKPRIMTTKEFWSNDLF